MVKARGEALKVLPLGMDSLFETKWETLTQELLNIPCLIRVRKSKQALVALKGNTITDEQTEEYFAHLLCLQAIPS